jgi:hypothetical protein
MYLVTYHNGHLIVENRFMDHDEAVRVVQRLRGRGVPDVQMVKAIPVDVDNGPLFTWAEKHERQQ